uniref:VTT domain-containing protein n=1 Tax=Chlamydomonas leiostraca TaxID=1034604 RepID=A0A7S0X0V0_9CHLO|mmetsp:Transcript_6748/g.16801  ORF Transcript_6748/g.16801 Transcript_6748/m.16801 type:complete len:337 (+) Transcript_6748:183-1193(+)
MDLATRVSSNAMASTSSSQRPVLRTLTRQACAPVRPLLLTNRNGHVANVANPAGDGSFSNNSNNIPRSLPKGKPEEEQPDGSFPGLGELAEANSKKKAGAAAGLLSVLGVAFLLGGGYLLKDQIKAFLDFFISAVEEWGPWGSVAYAAVYILLEVLALPAIPLTMTAGVIFGTVQGTIITSVSGTVAATIAFLIARYVARDKVRSLAYKQPKFAAIDRAIGANGLKFVTLLRLSPLLPLAASNYLYGLTSVDLGSYVLGSWIGMLPGTYAYVHAGCIGRAVLMEGEGAMSINPWQVGLGLGATLLALGFVGHLAKKAIEEVEDGEKGVEKGDGDGI